MSAHVLLNLINELSEKMRGLPSNEFHKLNSTEAQILEYIYHMTLKLFKII